MQRQRTLFFGSRPARAPRKDGENPLVPDRRFAATDPAAIEIRFNNDTATQFGGYPLWAEFLQQVGLNGKFSQHIKMSRGPLAFTAPELSRFLVDAKVLGADRLMHVETLRLDPMLTSVSGIDGLPSNKTLGVYLKSFDEGHERGLGHLNVSIVDQQWKKLYHGQDKPDVILDIDSTVFTVYGKQEEADRGYSFRKKDKPGYQAKFAFIGGSGLMVHQRLEPQSHNLNCDFDSFLSEAQARLPKKCRVWAIRGDGALYSEERVEQFERQGWIFAISAARTEHLRGAVTKIAEGAWEDGVDENGRPYSIVRMQYRPKTWTGEERTYIVSRRLKDDHRQARLLPGEQYKYFAYVTNHSAPLLTQFKFCVERCSLESYIKEAKHGFDYDRLPCAEANANRAYLQHVQLAYNLAILFQLRLAVRGVNRWTIDTLRARILQICGNLKRKAGRWLLSLPKWWPYRTVFQELLQRTKQQLQT